MFGSPAAPKSPSRVGQFHSWFHGTLLWPGRYGHFRSCAMRTNQRVCSARSEWMAKAQFEYASWPKVHRPTQSEEPGGHMLQTFGQVRLFHISTLDMFNRCVHFEGALFGVGLEGNPKKAFFVEARSSRFWATTARGSHGLGEESGARGEPFGGGTPPAACGHRNGRRFAHRNGMPFQDALFSISARIN